jgi:dephospho-CoA kinase
VSSHDRESLSGDVATKLKPFRVALTGGIASGKSTVADLFVAHGVALIDTDVIAREVVEPGRPAIARVVEAFGPTILGADGRLDRPRLRERIFSDPAARRTLEAILHPAIREEMERQSVALADAPTRALTRSSRFRCSPRADVATTSIECSWWTLRKRRRFGA